MKHPRAILAGLAVAVAALMLAACSSSKPPGPTPAQAAATHARLACTTLASATKTTGLTSSLSWISAAAVTLQDPPAGYFPRPFAADLQAVITPGLSSPPSSAVAALQGDCAALGVSARIWPAALTGP